MTTRTSLDNLYDAYGALVLSATGRPWWRRASIQSRPKTPYATIFFSVADNYEKQVVENVSTEGLSDKPYEQLPWGTAEVQAQVEFLGDRTGNTAVQAAHRFVSSLSIEERYWDIWQISALAGRVHIQDLSLIFREDIDPRVEVRFLFLANVVDPLPLPDTEIMDIHTQGILVIHNGIDDVETEIDVVINDDES